MAGRRWRLEVRARVTSTNSILLERARQGAPEGLALLARVQTAGRGRHGRRWMSLRGNLHLSVLLRPERPLRDCASLALVVALAARDALADLTPGLALRLKWPNDLLLDGAKLGGILLETAGSASGREGIVAGLGINLAAHPEDPLRPATSLAAWGLPAPPPEELAERILARLEPRYRRWLARGFGDQRAEWIAAGAGLGARARLRLGERELSGRILDVDAEGALWLDLGAERVRFLAGELFFEPAARTALAVGPAAR